MGQERRSSKEGVSSIDTDRYTLAMFSTQDGMVFWKCCCVSSMIEMTSVLMSINDM
jgi:hypothetical protein